MRAWSATILLGLATVALLAAPAEAGGDVKAMLRELQINPVSGAAPAFALDGLDGKRLALADLQGRPALLYFWATW